MTDSTSSNNKLQGKVAIVTGGASSMGEATALEFAAHGARAIVIADVQGEKGQNVAVSIGSNVCSYVHCDVSDEEQVKNLVDSTVKSCGRLDIIVLDLDLAAYDKLMAVNARGMAACVKHAVLGLVRIRVNCVSPGLVGTPLLKDMLGYENEEEDKVVESTYTLKGRLMRPKNVADAVVFLASEDSQFVTGHDLVVDGGHRG
ncbi:hypothetical protein RGQ29_003950 [Quercus rubra]|uniref:Uncharacterized protein n=1 Tax=Quercus rubra TaxID=3512 RepID=A0AAN7ED04_QUERU|nr:hypothetical protein RGQ29_003950 [Quercus rubra]